MAISFTFQLIKRFSIICCIIDSQTKMLCLLEVRPVAGFCSFYCYILVAINKLILCQWHHWFRSFFLLAASNVADQLLFVACQ